MKKLLVAVAVTMIAGPAAADLMKPAAPIVVRGTIASINGRTLTVKINSGSQLVVVLTPDAKVAALTVIGIDQIKQDSFIGTAAKPGANGTLQALEVHVFAPSMRGLGEGHRAWDLGKTSSMTNGNVGSVTDGVGSVAAAQGRMLTVDYKGGKQQIFVPQSVPIVAFAEGSIAQLVPGAHVFAFTMKAANGRLMAGQVAVGLNGVVPPM